MNINEMFTSQQLDGALSKISLKSPGVDLQYSLSSSDNFSVLDVKRAGISHQYVLVRASKPSLANLKDTTSVLQPDFYINSIQGEFYGAFDKTRLSSLLLPLPNDLNSVKMVLKALARLQLELLSVSKEEDDQKSFQVDVSKLNFPRSIEKSLIISTLEDLQIEFNKLCDTELRVRSVSSKVYLSENGTDCIFLGVSSQFWVPPAYDAFFYIFSLTSEQFRQRYFEEVTQFYFASFREALRDSGNKDFEKITRSYVETQTRTLLPIAKFKLASDSPNCQEILLNLQNYLEYPLIQQEDVYEVVKNKLQSSDYELRTYQLTPLVQKNGHLGEYFLLKIQVQIQGKIEELQLFAKFLMPHTDMARMMIESGVGRKEDFFYTDLCPLFEKYGLQSFAPKCYLSRLRGFLILDDLAGLGYTGLKPNVVLNCDELGVVLAKLAELHAATLIVEEVLSKKLEKKYRIGDEYSEYLEESVLLERDLGPGYVEQCFRPFRYIAGKFPELIENFDQEKFDAKAREIIATPLSNVRRSSTIRNVVNHGDMYIANILFKYGSDKTLRDAKLIDFQMLRYVPPAYEALFFIFFSSTKQTRNDHLSKLLEIYYENLTSHLAKFNLSSEEIYSKQQFSDDVANAKPAALAVAFSYCHLIHTDPDFREEVTHDQEKLTYYFLHNIEEFVDVSWKEEHYRTVMRGLIEDFVELISSDQSNVF